MRTWKPIGDPFGFGFDVRTTPPGKVVSELFNRLTRTRYGESASNPPLCRIAKLFMCTVSNSERRNSVSSQNSRNVRRFGRLAGRTLTESGLKRLLGIPPGYRAPPGM